MVRCWHSTADIVTHHSFFVGSSSVCTLVSAGSLCVSSHSTSHLAHTHVKARYPHMRDAHCGLHAVYPQCQQLRLMPLLLSAMQDLGFDPSKSSTAQLLDCQHELCQCGSPGCACMQKKCYYSRHYGTYRQHLSHPCCRNAAAED